MKVMFIFAHPDDEAFSSGGTIHKLSKAGHSVHLVTATKGEAGEVGTPPLTTKEKLGIVREKELKNAAKVLGVSKIDFLGFIDGTLKSVKLLDLKNSIEPILTKNKPDVVVTFDKYGASNHPDHIAISKATTELFFDYAKKSSKKVRLYHTANPQSYLKKYEKTDMEYTAFGKQKGTPDDLISTRVQIDFKVKDKACTKHKTQHRDWERFKKRAEVVDLNVEFFQLIHENDLV